MVKDQDHTDWPPPGGIRCVGCRLPLATDEDHNWHDEAHPECSGGCGHHLCWDPEACDRETDWRTRALVAESKIRHMMVLDQLSAVESQKNRPQGRLGSWGRTFEKLKNTQLAVEPVTGYHRDQPRLVRWEPLAFGGLLPSYVSYWEAGGHAPVEARHRRRSRCIRYTVWIEAQAVVALFRFLRGK